MKRILRRPMNLPPTKRPVVISPPGSFRFLQTAPHKKKKMKTKNPADALVNGTGSITVLSLNTHWVARCPVRLPDPLVHAQLRRLLRRRGGEVPALFGFQARITPAGPSAEIRVFSGQREMFTCGVAWAENDWAAELWRSLLSRSWAMCPSEEPRWVPAPALPWMVTLYSRCFERLPLADGVALAVFQRSLASVLLCRHLPQWEAAKLFSSTSTGEIEGARNSSDDRKAQCGDAVVQSITA